MCIRIFINYVFTINIAPNEFVFIIVRQKVSGQYYILSEHLGKTRHLQAVAGSSVPPSASLEYVTVSWSILRSGLGLLSALIVIQFSRDLHCRDSSVTYAWYCVPSVNPTAHARSSGPIWFHRSSIYAVPTTPPAKNNFHLFAEIPKKQWIISKLISLFNEFRENV